MKNQVIIAGEKEFEVKFDRVNRTLNKEQLQCACSYKSQGSDAFVKPQWMNEFNDGKEYTPSHNIAPTDITPVLISKSKFRNSSCTDRIIKPMMWGVIPPWHEGDYKKHNLSTNNCRLENINTSKLFSPILHNGGRCVIAVEGFYEWQTTDKTSKLKQPYYIYSPQAESVQIEDPKTWPMNFNEDTGWTGVNLLFIAGLYNVWQKDETVIYSYSVITMNSNSTFDWLHHRMPAILNTEEQINAWLDIDGIKPDIALRYLSPVEKLSWHPVSTLVNNSRNKSADCNKRLKKSSKSEQKTLSSWFVKSEKRKSNGDSSVSKKIKTEDK